MNSSTYKQPPIAQTYLSHAVGTALLGGLLPVGEHLNALHVVIRPIVELIPNAVLVTSRSPDPVFAQTFIGLSLLIAFAVLMFYVVAMRGYHTKTFESLVTRWAALLWMWLIVIFMLFILWYWPYLDPLSKGRAYFLINAATSSYTGVIIAMNQLVVGIPLICFLVLYLGHSCTTVRHSTRFS